VNNLLYLLLKFLVSIAIPYLLKFIEPNASWSMKTLLGISVFLGWSSLDALYYLRKWDTVLQRQTDLWLLEHDLDMILANIRKHYREIVKEFYGDADLFRDHFHARFVELEGMLQAAAERKELFVRDFHFQRTELLLNTFRDDETGILRYVWIIRKDEPLFDEKWEHYCDQILKGTTEGAIKGVRALLVLGEGVAETDAVVQAVAGFYDGTKAHDYRLVEELAYNHRLADNRFEGHYVDFGIYGARYIYLTSSYGEITAGKFCKDRAVIGRYTKFFDSIWTAHTSKKLPKAGLPKIKLHELFKVKW